MISPPSSNLTPFITVELKPVPNILIESHFPRNPILLPIRCYFSSFASIVVLRLSAQSHLYRLYDRSPQVPNYSLQLVRLIVSNRAPLLLHWLMLQLQFFAD